MKSQWNQDGVNWNVPLATGDQLGIWFREIRRERTGVHALVAILLNTTILGYDTFNIGRREERQRLGNAAHKMILGAVTKDALSNNDLLHFLDLAALDTPRLWEEERIVIETYDASTPCPGPVQFVLKPYIIRGGGTIFYAPPKSGKSYLLQCMAIHIATGQGNMWPVGEVLPVLYVNLERDRAGFIRRENALKEALGISIPSNVHYLHARGLGLSPLRQKIRHWLKEHPGSGVVLDSISRSQSGGSLTDDDVGNHFVDMMHGLEPAWWAAVGHTPRASADHLFGSIMFDAGMDIGVKVSKQQKDFSLGVRLEITDANDIGHFEPEFLALDFGGPDEPLVSIREAKETEFGDLLLQEKMSQEEKIIMAILNSEHGNMTPAEAAKATGLASPNVSRALKADAFVKLPSVKGRGVPYGLRETRGT